MCCAIVNDNRLSYRCKTKLKSDLFNDKTLVTILTADAVCRNSGCRCL